MVQLEDDELIDITVSNSDTTTAPKNDNWFINFRHFLHGLILSSESSQVSSNEFEESCNSPSTCTRHAVNKDTRMRNEVRYFFMNPCQKYKTRRRKPFKLGIQIFKIAVVTLQLIIFGQKNQDLVSFMNDTQDVFKVYLLGNQSHFYTKEDVNNEINSIRQQYAQFEEVLLGNYGFGLVNAPDRCNMSAISSTASHENYQHPILMCIEEYLHFKANIDGNVFDLDVKDKNTSCYCVKPWTKNENMSSLYRDFIPLNNGSLLQIEFSRLNTLQMYLGIRTVRMMSSHSFHSADLYNITVTIKFDNSAHSGKILQSMDLKFSLTPPPYEGNLNTKPVVVLMLILDLIIILTCFVSALLCVRSLCRGWHLGKSFQKYYWRRKRKELVWTQKLEFFNGWHFLIIVSDLLTILGSVTKIVIEMEWKGVINYDQCSLFLGVGCLCVWIGVLRYVGFFHQYNILVLTMKKSLPHVLRFMVCASLLYLGFMFCGWVVLGPYHHKFRNPVVTSEALFSLINGDDMYMTFEEMNKKSSLAWVFSQIYLYIFIALFIYMVLSLFLAVILETYETIKEWQKNEFPPQNEIQRFIAEHAEEDERHQYELSSDIYCCYCLYHGDDPDFDDSSDVEAVVNT